MVPVAEVQTTVLSLNATNSAPSTTLECPLSRRKDAPFRKKDETSGKTKRRKNSLIPPNKELLDVAMDVGDIGIEESHQGIEHLENFGRAGD